MIRLNKILLCTIMLILGGMLQACVPTVVAVSEPPEGKFLFVEIRVELVPYRFGRAISIYSFDPVTNILETRYRKESFPLPSFDWGLTGLGEFSSSGESARNFLHVINELPFTIDIPRYVLDEGDIVLEENNIRLELVEISEDGSLVIKIDTQYVVLPAGESWERKVATDVLSNGIMDKRQITTSITNYGWLDRTQIQLRP